jgi:ATP/maltotriose-dependent transcriptional regulator MalT
LIGNHRLVLDYLSEEVLDRLPGHLLTFLLQTSILERLCGPLCDAVLGLTAIVTQNVNQDSYSQLLFVELERANLFLIALDEMRYWYRYHHLFGEVLRARLERGASPATVRELHRRAAHWYGTQGFWQEALPHTYAAEDWELAAQALEQLGEGLIVQGALPRLCAQIRALPHHIRVAHPRLLFYEAIGEHKNFNVTGAEQLLTEALNAPMDDPMLQAEILLQLSDCQRTNGHFALAKTTLQQAMAGPLLPRPRAQALISRAFEALVEGDWQAVRAAHNSALELALAHPDPLLRFEVAINGHAVYLVLPGGAVWIERFCQAASHWNVPEFSPLRASLYWLSGYGQLFTCDLKGAVATINKALALGKQLGGLNKLGFDAGSQQVFLLALSGDLTTARQQISDLLTIMAQPEIAALARLCAAWYHYIEGWLYLQQGQIEEATAVAEKMEAIAHPYEWPSSFCMRLMLRGLLVLRNKPTAAIELLQQACAGQERFLETYAFGDARMALAYALLITQHHAAAREVIRTAFETHIQRGTPGLLLLIGTGIVLPVLQFAYEEQIYPDTAAALIAAFDGSFTPRYTPTGCLNAIIGQGHHRLDALDPKSTGHRNPMMPIAYKVGIAKANKLDWWQG